MALPLAGRPPWAQGSIVMPHLPEVQDQGPVAVPPEEYHLALEPLALALGLGSLPPPMLNT